MRKIILSIFLFFSSLIQWPYTLQGINEHDAVFVLPSDLKVLENEAFSGTAVKTVYFPNGFLILGDYAFSNADYLTDVYVPATTLHIEEHAFTPRDTFTLHGAADSYAQRWAFEHQVTFSADSFTTTKKPSGRTIDQEAFTEYDKSIRILTGKISRQTADNERSMRPQDRTELNPIDYRFP